MAEVPGRVRRTIQVRAGDVRVEDQRIGGPAAILGTLWLLHPGADPSAATFSPDARPVQATPDRAAAWFSAYYGDRVEAPAFAVRALAPDDVLVSIFKDSAASVAAGRYDE